MTRRIEMTPEERRALWKAGLELPATKVVQPKWQPIETAPLNKWVLISFYWKKNQEFYDPQEEWNIDIGSYDGGRYIDGCYVDLEEMDAMWMALPAPPDIIGEQIIQEEEEYEIRRELDFEDEFPHGLEGDE